VTPAARRRLLVLLAVAAALRLSVVAFSARTTVDVLRYHRVAEHVLDVSWNPYEAPRLYPYPPLWVWFEVGAGWLERHGANFAVAVKLPVLLAELGIVVLLAGWSQRGAWIYALHPVPLLVSGFHGQFDSLMLFFILAAIRTWEGGAADRSALLLSGAIATKTFPVLLLPFFWLSLPTLGRRLRFAALATVPVLASLVPYLLDNAAAVRRELLAYGGVADFGWIGVYRGLLFLRDGRLLRSTPDTWGSVLPVAKLLFLVAFAVLLMLVWRRLRLALHESCLAVLLLFLATYGAVSAQYLLWPVALGARRAGGFLAAYGVAATAGLLGFYAFLAPGVLFADQVARPTGTLWVAGAAAVLVVSAVWLVVTLARARTR
jgi:hypothetical protein